MTPQSPTLEEVQAQVDDWITTIGVRYFSELTNMAILTEEVGEMARIIARRYGDQSEKPSDAKLDLGDERATENGQRMFRDLARACNLCGHLWIPLELKTHGKFV